MKHPIIILALYFLSIVAILYSMTGGGSADKKAETNEVINVENSTVAEADTTNAPSIEPSSLTSALVNGESENKEAANTDVNQAVATDETVSEATTEAVDDTAAVTEEVLETTEATAEDAAVKTEEVSAETTENVADATETNTTETEAQFSESSAEELLLMAREAYWNNGLEESAEIYQQLITLNPDVVDYKGELGNVFWRQGFPKKAAELYAEISLPMIEAGSADKVANMVGFIGLFYPEKATEIHNKLEANK